MALAEQAGFDEQLITQVSSKAVIKGTHTRNVWYWHVLLDVPRPENVCLLSSTTYQTLNFQPCTLKEGIRRALDEGVL